MKNKNSNNNHHAIDYSESLIARMAHVSTSQGFKFVFVFVLVVFCFCYVCVYGGDERRNLRPVSRSIFL